MFSTTVSSLTVGELCFLVLAAWLTKAVAKPWFESLVSGSLVSISSLKIIFLNIQHVPNASRIDAIATDPTSPQLQVREGNRVLRSEIIQPQTRELEAEPVGSGFAAPTARALRLRTIVHAPVYAKTHGERLPPLPPQTTEKPGELILHIRTIVEPTIYLN